MHSNRQLDPLRKILLLNLLSEQDRRQLASENEFSPFHPTGEIWDTVYESGNPANKHLGVQTYVVGPGSAATFDVVVQSQGAYPLVTHSLTGALRGAFAILVASPDAKPALLMLQTPWKADIPQGEITPAPAH